VFKPIFNYSVMIWCGGFCAK